MTPQCRTLQGGAEQSMHQPSLKGSNQPAPTSKVLLGHQAHSAHLFASNHKVLGLATHLSRLCRKAWLGRAPAAHMAPHTCCASPTSPSSAACTPGTKDRHVRVQQVWNTGHSQLHACSVVNAGHMLPLADSRLWQGSVQAGGAANTVQCCVQVWCQVLTLSICSCSNSTSPDAPTCSSPSRWAT